MTQTAQLRAPDARPAKRQPPAASPRAKTALIAELRALWRDCNVLMAELEDVACALKAGHLTAQEALDYFGPDFVRWMVLRKIAKASGDGG